METRILMAKSLKFAEIPQLPREAFSRNGQMLYDIAIGIGVVNPFPVWADRCWWLEGDNLLGDCIGFTTRQAIECLKRGEFIHGGKIQLAGDNQSPSNNV